LKFLFILFFFLSFYLLLLLFNILAGKGRSRANRGRRY